METLQMLSWCCLVFTIWMFSTGLSDLRRMISGNSTDNIQFLPFLSTAVNNLGWLYYGQLKGDWTLITVNSIGVILQISYILAYLYFSTEKFQVVSKVAFAGAVLAIVYLYFTMLVLDAEQRLNKLGLLCSAFTISMYLSPLADLAKIVRTRSTKCLSFSLTVATILTSTSWTLYGLQLSDYYIVVPNVPGILTSLVRFWLFWSYASGQDKYTYRPVQA
ncbi:sugar transporter SWEET1 isoform X1 [Carcharodon carcharias]|uniref:sugar transporter SWEET1 isoform X1 n=1 Tax=Carcharodon carcharias TaxID=13397 RepID=UPI001B7E7CE6|nr:sugar transporter SWEET1 isoform X1 [Carcharodon carcharias]XP_041037667.1 sugar transporter SWEET1 isoform X1 [Carcharodon carcharias]XP_041037668.1 sugar transporter SWEET1 isoform X1 [Carcharodon carcharias]XP_041037669.1 sugar transporter SWEET1 isoform X1 [Carcharodon carcharias]XP_041037670.1 sugar transporter SWEET1 isoform X1 [Carcharodon carcharias]XP_041037671.1 sugar transporter SWEET1 isoform X1 [Carcharodon carcharias]XP_041037672.1 sugar transporter SWEET1 isoform X1 [Carchar